MDIDNESFKQSIIELDKQLVLRLKQGEKLVNISDNFKADIKKLLLKSAESRHWNEIVDHIAFLIYAGGVQDFLLENTANSYNHVAAKHNAGEVKKINDARKGGNAKGAKNAGVKKQVIDIWQSGKYTSKDICAEQECAALGLPFSTMRKWLINK